MSETNLKPPVFYNVLHIEDDPEDARLVARMLARADSCSLELTWVTTLGEALEAAEETKFHAVLIDYYLGSDTAISFIRNLPSSLSKSAIVMLTGCENSVLNELASVAEVDFFVNKDQLEYPVLERAVHCAIRNKDQQNRMRDFSRILAHDLLNPVGQVDQCLELLKDAHLSSSTEEDVLEVIEMGKSACGRISSILSDLRDYSLSQDGALITEQFSLNAVVDEVVGSLSAYLSPRNATVESGELGNAQLDRRVFFHVVQNLIQNGIKYNRSERPRVSVDISRVDGRPLLTFADNGIGIDKKSLTKVFEPMARLNSDDEYEGTGLGLSVCKDVVERHGGRVWVESPGTEIGGSTFYVELPA